MLARQALYHLIHTSSPFFALVILKTGRPRPLSSYFMLPTIARLTYPTLFHWDRMSQTFCLGWLGTMIPPISVSYIVWGDGYLPPYSPAGCDGGLMNFLLSWLALNGELLISTFQIARMILIFLPFLVPPPRPSPPCPHFFTGDWWHSGSHVC
jgi:hypothetical protein